ncbi:MAG: hypothetical protein QXX19_03430 [Candidatus Caldarchaeum sp.]
MYEKRLPKARKVPRFEVVKCMANALRESDLRRKACEWLVDNFPDRQYLIKPMVFHSLSTTLSGYLRKKFRGKTLINIPKHDELHIRPDIIALLIRRDDGHARFLWVIGECKVGEITVNDFRQAKFYFELSNTYEAYLFCGDEVSEEVRILVRKGAHVYNGTDRWGNIIRKRVIFLKYKNGTFKKLIIS